MELATTTSGIKAGVAGVTSGGHFVPQCGSLRGFAVYQKWGQNPGGAITSAVTIPEPLLSQRKNRGHTRFRPGLIGRKEKTACTSQRAVGTSPARRPGKKSIAERMESPSKIVPQ